MISIDDWSQLITVNFRGGMGGDFFCILLNNNFKQTPYLKTDSKQYLYTDCPFSIRWPYHNRLKGLNKIKTYYNDRNNLDRSDAISFEEIKFFDIFFDDQTPIDESLNFYFYDKYRLSFNDNRKRVANFHNLTYDLLNAVDLQKTFPKSKNINFFSTNFSYLNIAENILLLYKLPIDNILSFGKSAIVPVERNIKPNNDGFFIDCFSLLFEEKCYDKQLSDYLGIKVTLNKSRVSNYKQEQLEILDQFGIDPFKIYEDDYLVEIGKKIYDMRVNGRSN